MRLRAAFTASDRSHGSRRLACALQNQGLTIGRYKVRTLVRKEDIKLVWKRKFLHTADSRHDLPVAENLLGRWFNPARSNQAWVSDITYIRTYTEWLHLAVVMDLYSRRVVGWAWRRT